MGSPTVNNYTAGDGRPFWIVGLEGDAPLAGAGPGRRAARVADRRALRRRRRAGPVNAGELIAELDAIFATRPLDEWAEAFDAEPDLFWSPVNTIDDLLVDEQFHAAGRWSSRCPTRTAAWPMLATPADFDGRPPVAAVAGAPRSASTPARCWPSSAYDPATSTRWSPTASPSRPPTHRRRPRADRWASSNATRSDRRHADPVARARSPACRHPSVTDVSIPGSTGWSNETVLFDATLGRGRRPAGAPRWWRASPRRATRSSPTTPSCDSTP